jgi:heterodisulfide reductase subunit A-like polyferredoxin
MSAAYDLVVIRTGPAGQKGAIAAAKLGKKVAVVDRKEMVGGVCLRAKLHRVYAAQIDGQTKTPSLAALERLAKALRVPLAELLQ